MRNSIAYGWRVALRAASLQIGAAVLAGILGLIVVDARSGIAAVAGGAIISAGNLLFALRFFGRGVAPVRDALRSMYAAEMVKWVWLGATLYLAIAVWQLPFPAFVAGMAAAQIAFWLSLLATR